MARNSATVLRCTLLAFLFTLSVSIHPFDFYQLAIQWPKSYCNTGSVNYTCQTPIKTDFVIHGLWPQYTPDIMIAPFNQTGCTSINPTPRADITTRLLQPIISDMTTYWPNLRNSSSSWNLGFWRGEWERHGMCSAYPTQPLTYFRAALQKIKTYNIKQILQNAVPSIIPSSSKSYNRTSISSAIKGKVVVKPEIHCNRDSANVVQLMEVRICFDRDLNLKDCSRAFTACPVENLVRYPTP